MIKVKAWCLPKPTETALRLMYEELKRALNSVPEVANEPFCVLFPPDLMKFGLGEEICVEVSGLRYSRKITREVRNRIANHVGRAVLEHFPESEIYVDVLVSRYDEGRWSSVRAD